MKSITIAIRALNSDLTIRSLSLLDQIKGERRIKFNTGSPETPGSGDYLIDLLFDTKTDWVINVDEDAFVYDIEKLFSLIDYMDKNDYHICGVSDGGVVGCRKHNPVAMNPFFNIIDARKIRTIPRCESGKSTDDKIIGDFTEDLKKYTPHHLLKDNFVYKYDNFQWQYYPIYFHLLRNNIKFLYLDVDEHTDNHVGYTDGHSSFVKDHNGDGFLIHTWHGRCYNDLSSNECKSHSSRIDEAYNLSITKNKTDVGIVVPAIDVEFDVLQRFIDGVRYSNPSVSYKVYFSSNKMIGITNGLFNKNKLMNYGIKQLMNNCEVIICVDVDIIPAPGMIDLTYQKAIQTKCNIFSMARHIDPVDDWDQYLKNIKNYEKIEMDWWGKGGWNAMSSEVWKKSGGCNEELFGWGYDAELHERIIKKGINIFTIMNKATFHMKHESRAPNHIKTQRNNVDVAKSKDWLNHNWLDNMEGQG